MFLFCVPYRLFWKCLFNKVFEITEMLLSDFCMYISLVFMNIGLPSA